MFQVPIVKYSHHNAQMGIPPIRIRRKPPMFAPSIWNVHTITSEGGSRTNNICEGWNNGFSKLVGHSHPTIWRAIDSIRKDQVQVATILFVVNHQPSVSAVSSRLTCETCVLTVGMA